MVKIIDLPAPQISYLKKVHLELELTGNHFSMLAAYNGGAPEQLILSILQDLVKEDVSKLSRNEALYLFTLTRLNSIGSNVTMEYTCPKCHKSFETEVDISDVNVRNTDKNYKIPTIEWKIENEAAGEQYNILPSFLSDEISILDWFETTQNISRKDMTKDKKTLTRYEIMRTLMCLTKSDGNRLFSDVSSYADMEKTLSFNSYKTVQELYKIQEEQSNYGMLPNAHKVKCGGCGETTWFHLPTLYGLYHEDKLQ